MSVSNYLTMYLLSVGQISHINNPVYEGLIKQQRDVTLLKHSFSVEIISKEYVRSISISDETRDRVLFEGNLGKLIDLSLEEGDVLEFTGENGIIRINITYEQIRSFFEKTTAQASAPRRGALKKPPTANE